MEGKKRAGHFADIADKQVYPALSAVRNRNGRLPDAWQGDFDKLSPAGRKIDFHTEIPLLWCMTGDGNNAVCSRQKAVLFFIVTGTR
ncbi:hypothetical protein BK376_23510 [Escherichia coli]|nr:hypothetical protein BK376_23510 [Escherichia coli]OJS53634.1 hypothetical protein BK404_26050 [Escherichia coli]OJS64227.1 hypothetical protein BK406_27965 [Escherichia coli]PGG46141.1 hypothetical protein BMR14_16325 [Escherichia coli]